MLEANSRLKVWAAETRARRRPQRRATSTSHNHFSCTLYPLILNRTQVRISVFRHFIDNSFSTSGHHFHTHVLLDQPVQDLCLPRCGRQPPAAMAVLDFQRDRNFTKCDPAILSTALITMPCPLLAFSLFHPIVLLTPSTSLYFKQLPR